MIKISQSLCHVIQIICNCTGKNVQYSDKKTIHSFETNYLLDWNNLLEKWHSLWQLMKYLNKVDEGSTKCSGESTALHCFDEFNISFPPNT